MMMTMHENGKLIKTSFCARFSRCSITALVLHVSLADKRAKKHAIEASHFSKNFLTKNVGVLSDPVYYSTLLYNFLLQANTEDNRYYDYKSKVSMGWVPQILITISISYFYDRITRYVLPSYTIMFYLTLSRRC